ncbi:DUF6771 family protein [Sphingomonas immobilis]|uniref:DUF6771 family protein n=1 Tax=Sphingomonas immobilis TaxID=3063997 RepID=UPI0031338627
MRCAPPEPFIAQSILAAPGWARIGITMPDPGLRERAAHELARAITAGGSQTPIADPDPLPLRGASRNMRNR